jgi:ATP-dependent DNA helicase RecG
MTEQELQQVLQRLLAEGEGECVEFKDANDNFSTSDIGKYFSALANEANLRGLASAWLVFGVDNKTRTVIGTPYRREHERLHSLKHQIAQGTDPATTLLNPYVAELSWKLDGPERGYEHFHPPFLLTTSQLYQRIRPLRLSFLPPGQLIPVEISKYDQRIVLEALHNCIAHQDYTRCERVLVIERVGELEFQNAGEFFDGTPDDYVRGTRSPRRYRNRLLAEAMMRLGMIDTMGFGIREVMWKGQASRYLPLPDFDLTEPGHVKLRLQGRFLDENYSRALLAHADLPWPDVLALDTIQKGGSPDDDLVKGLRHRGLIEGRKPKLHVAADIAAATETEAEYLHHRAFDDTYFCDMIVEYLKKFGSAKRAKFNRLLEGKLSDLLNPRQQRNKIDSLLRRLQQEGKIKVEGYGKGAIWRLVANRPSSQ